MEPEAAQPEVTVVVPTHDRWDVLERFALASALRQRHVAVEVVVVDDGSARPAPPAVVSDPRVRAVRHEEARGVAHARNTGIRAARGTWIAFLDDDDLWAPTKLRAQLAASAAAGAAWSYTAAIAVDELLQPLFRFPLVPAQDLAATLIRWNEIHAGGSNVVVRRTVLEELGGFDEELFQLADWDLWLRLARAAPAVAIDDALVAYVVHGGSMLLRDRRDVRLEFARFTRKHRSLARELASAPDAARFERWVARGHRRAGRRREAAVLLARSALRNRDPGAIPRALAALAGDTATERVRSRLARRRGERPQERPDWLRDFRQGA